MSSQFKISFLMLIVILSCCINVITLEYMVKEYSSCHHLITFSQFLFITICSFSLNRFKPKIPLRKYFGLVVLYFLVALISNYSLAFNISMPLFMIFKSGSLIANMFLSVFVLKRKYKLRKYISVFVITLGIILCTLASSNNIQSNNTDNVFYTTWLVGIFLLTFSLVGAAQTGIFQEKLAMQYGHNTNEMMFFCHALLLPSFIFLFPNIKQSILIFNQNSNLWFLLLINVLTSYCCSRSVFLLSGLCSSLTITLLITLRKFFSLILSIYLFKNVFSLQHWIGTILVFSGTFLFSEFNLSLNLFNKLKNVKKQKND